MSVHRQLQFLVFLGLLMSAPSWAEYSNPESAIYDEARKRYFVSNVGNGHLYEIDSLGVRRLYSTQSPWLLGMVIVGDTLFVTNRTYVRGFDLTTNTLVYTKYISGSSDLNDITADTSGYLYITGSSDQGVYRLHVASGVNSKIVSGIYWPNGILFDAQENRLLMCSFGSNAPIRAISLDGSSVSIVMTTPYTDLDGLTEDNDGNIYMSSWGSNSIYRVARDFTGTPIRVASGLNDPADIYFDRVNNILVSPNFHSNTVSFIDMDTDNDRVLDVDDNCPEDYNPDQEDTDGDGAGDSCEYVCGDANGDKGVNVGDAVYVITYVFKGGAAPDPVEAGDASCDGTCNVGDAVYLVGYVFKGGAEPCAGCP